MSDNTFDWSAQGDGLQVQDALQGPVSPEEMKARVEEQVRMEQAGAEES